MDKTYFTLYFHYTVTLCIHIEGSGIRDIAMYLKGYCSKSCAYECMWIYARPLPIRSCAYIHRFHWGWLWDKIMHNLTNWLYIFILLWVEWFKGHFLSLLDCLYWPLTFRDVTCQLVLQSKYQIFLFTILGWQLITDCLLLRSWTLFVVSVCFIVWQIP